MQALVGDIIKQHENQNHQGPGASAAVEKLIDEVLNSEPNIADQNVTRLKKVAGHFKEDDSSNSKSSILLGVLLEPIEDNTNLLFHRTALRWEMRATLDEAKKAEMENESKQIFKDYMSGTIGTTAMAHYTALAQDSRLAAFDNGDTSFIVTIFAMLVWGIGECFRRLVLPMAAFPFRVFALLDLVLEDFLAKLADFKAVFERCSECIDPELTLLILDALDRVELLEEPHQIVRHNKIQQLLHDTAVHAPISSDIVEALNGRTQASVHRLRGRSKLAASAAEESFLDSINLEHKNMVESLKPEYLPPNPGISKANACRIHKKKGESVTAESGGYLLCTSKDKLNKAKQRKLRKLDASNVYQRKKMEGGATLSPAEWAQRVKEIAKEWNSMSEDEKYPFVKEANLQNNCRESLLQTPLETAAALKEANLPKEEHHSFIHGIRDRAEYHHFCEKVSLQRLELNEKLFQQAPEFSKFGLGLMDYFSSLKPEWVNLTKPYEVISDFFKSVFHAAPPSRYSRDGCPSAAHHTTCGKSTDGHCKKDDHIDFAIKVTPRLVEYITTNKLEAGSLLQLQVGTASDHFFLGPTVIKPPQVMLATAHEQESRENGDVCFKLVSPAESVPDFKTSLHVLRELQAISGLPNEYIQIRKCLYTMSFFDLTKLQVWVTARSEYEVLPVEKQAKPKSCVPKFVLPFGLKQPKRPRRQRGNPKKKQKQGTSKMPSESESENSGSDGHGTGMSSEAPSSSSPSSASTSEAESGADADKDSGHHEPIAITTVAEQEAKELDAASADHSKDAELRESLRMDLTSYKSVFCHDVGIQDVEFAPARGGRLARCRQCEEQIARGSLRFVFQHHQLEPNGYVHKQCIVPYTRTRLQCRKRGALLTMEQVLAQLSSLAADKSAHPEALAAVQSASHELKYGSASSH